MARNHLLCMGIFVTLSNRLPSFSPKTKALSG
nr:MAG TPA: Alpha,alpha-trehalose-phosphate synthase (UDP-forming) [Microviridae sp.]